MGETICGAKCSQCFFQEGCHGCKATQGHPFGGECLLAECCLKKGLNTCHQCNTPCTLKQQIISEFNQLHIEDMPEITELNALKGAFVNLEYSTPSGQMVKLLDDNKIYLGNQICKTSDQRCYGLAANATTLVVSEYGPEGTDAEIVVYKRRR